MIAGFFVLKRREFGVDVLCNVCKCRFMGRWEYVWCEVLGIGGRAD